MQPLVKSLQLVPWAYRYRACWSLLSVVPQLKRRLLNGFSTSFMPLGDQEVFNAPSIGVVVKTVCMPNHFAAFAKRQQCPGFSRLRNT